MSHITIQGVIMKKFNNLFIILSCAIIGFTVVLVKSFYNNKLNIKCAGSFFIHDVSGIMHSSVWYSLEDGKGMTKISAYKIENNITVAEVKLWRTYSYEDNGSFITLSGGKSRVKTSGENADVKIKGLIPDFFLDDNDKGYFLSIKKINNSEWLFYGTTGPVMYCSNIQ